jgi:hypothetical protein
MADKQQFVGNQWDRGEIAIPDDRLVGIEIEVENCPGLHLYEAEDGHKKVATECPKWYFVKDNSLRNNGAEFVSIPLPVSKVAGAVEALFRDVQDAYKMKWRGSIRTGIHAHINVRDFEALHLQNLSVTYPLLEPALFDYVGREREECIYCVPWYRAQDDAKLAAVYLADPTSKNLFNRLRNMANRLSKYSALFYAPITRIGTVEFRHAPTWLEQDRIVRWVNICESIVSYARKAESPQAVLNAYDTNPMKFFDDATHGHLDVPRNFQRMVERTGSDLLAASLFPEVLPEWVRIFDKYMPLQCTTKKNPYAMPPLPIKKKPTSTPYEPKIGASQTIGLTKYYYHGPSNGWISNKQAPPPQIVEQQAAPATLTWNSVYDPGTYQNSLDAAAAMQAQQIAMQVDQAAMVSLNQVLVQGGSHGQTVQGMTLPPAWPADDDFDSIDP